MDSYGIRQIIKYIQHNCKTTLTPRQTEQLREILNRREYNIYKLRIVYRIAIDNLVYPECPCCHKAITTQEDFTIDHIIPRALGGTDEIENLQPMHKKCNSHKGCTMPEQTTCSKTPVTKHHKRHNTAKNKEHEIVKSRTPEELYQKCKRIDQARATKYRASSNCHTR